MAVIYGERFRQTYSTTSANQPSPTQKKKKQTGGTPTGYGEKTYTLTRGEKEYLVERTPTGYTEISPKGERTQIKIAEGGGYAEITAEPKLQAGQYYVTTPTGERVIRQNVTGVGYFDVNIKTGEVIPRYIPTEKQPQPITQDIKQIQQISPVKPLTQEEFTKALQSGQLTMPRRIATEETISTAKQPQLPKQTYEEYARQRLEQKYGDIFQKFGMTTTEFIQDIKKIPLSLVSKAQELAQLTPLGLIVPPPTTRTPEILKTEQQKQAEAYQQREQEFIKEAYGMTPQQFQTITEFQKPAKYFPFQNPAKYFPNLFPTFQITPTPYIKPIKTGETLELLGTEAKDITQQITGIVGRYEKAETYEEQMRLYTEYLPLKAKYDVIFSEFETTKEQYKIEWATADLQLKQLQYDYEQQLGTIGKTKYRTLFEEMAFRDLPQIKYVGEGVQALGLIGERVSEKKLQFAEQLPKPLQLFIKPQAQFEMEASKIIQGFGQELPYKYPEYTLIYVGSMLAGEIFGSIAYSKPIIELMKYPSVKFIAKGGGVVLAGGITAGVGYGVYKARAREDYGQIANILAETGLGIVGFAKGMKMSYPYSFREQIQRGFPAEVGEVTTKYPSLKPSGEVLRGQEARYTLLKKYGIELEKLSPAIQYPTTRKITTTFAEYQPQIEQLGTIGYGYKPTLKPTFFEGLGIKDITPTSLRAIGYPQVAEPMGIKYLTSTAKGTRVTELFEFKGEQYLRVQKILPSGEFKGFIKHPFEQYKLIEFKGTLPISQRPLTFETLREQQLLKELKLEGEFYKPDYKKYGIQELYVKGKMATIQKGEFFYDVETKQLIKYTAIPREKYAFRSVQEIIATEKGFKIEPLQQQIARVKLIKGGYQLYPSIVDIKPQAVTGKVYTHYLGKGGDIYGGVKVGEIAKLKLPQILEQIKAYEFISGRYVKFTPEINLGRVPKLYPLSEITSVPKGYKLKLVPAEKQYDILKLTPEQYAKQLQKQGLLTIKYKTKLSAFDKEGAYGIATSTPPKSISTPHYIEIRKGIKPHFVEYEEIMTRNKEFIKLDKSIIQKITTQKILQHELSHVSDYLRQGYSEELSTYQFTKLSDVFAFPQKVKQYPPILVWERQNILGKIISGSGFGRKGQVYIQPFGLGIAKTEFMPPKQEFIPSKKLEMYIPTPKLQYKKPVGYELLPPQPIIKQAFPPMAIFIGGTIAQTIRQPVQKYEPFQIQKPIYKQITSPIKMPVYISKPVQIPKPVTITEPILKQVTIQQPIPIQEPIIIEKPIWREIPPPVPILFPPRFPSFDWGGDRTKGKWDLGFVPKKRKYKAKYIVLPDLLSVFETEFRTGKEAISPTLTPKVRGYFQSAVSGESLGYVPTEQMRMGKLGKYPKEQNIFGFKTSRNKNPFDFRIKGKQNNIFEFKMPKGNRKQKTKLGFKMPRIY